MEALNEISKDHYEINELMMGLRQSLLNVDNLKQHKESIVFAQEAYADIAVSTAVENLHLSGKNPFLVDPKKTNPTKSFDNFVQRMEGGKPDSAAQALHQGNLSQKGYIAVKAIDTIFTAFKTNEELKLKVAEVAGALAGQACDTVIKFSRHVSQSMARQEHLQKAAVELFTDNLTNMTMAAAELRNKAKALLDKLEKDLQENEKQWIKLENNNELSDSEFESQQKELEIQLNLLLEAIKETEKRIFASTDDLLGTEFIAYTKDLQAQLTKMVDKNLDAMRALQNKLVETQKEISSGLAEFAKIMQENQKRTLTMLSEKVIAMITVIKKPHPITSPNPTAKQHRPSIFSRGGKRQPSMPSKTNSPTCSSKP
jgi:hypothetical protein